MRQKSEVEERARVAAESALAVKIRELEERTFGQMVSLRGELCAQQKSLHEQTRFALEAQLTNSHQALVGEVLQMQDAG